METQNMLHDISLSGLGGSDWPEFSRYNTDKSGGRNSRSLNFNGYSSNGSATSTTGQNGSVASSSGYETGSSNDKPPDLSAMERGRSNSIAKHDHAFLTVNGNEYPRQRRRSLSVNRYENPPDSPPARASNGGHGVLRPASSLVTLGRNRNDDWSMSTSRRNFRFTQEGFDMARSAPIVHKPTLRIGIEGDRTHFHSKSEDYPAYPVREISSARPGGRYRPSSVTTGRAVEGPLISRTENRDHFSEGNYSKGSASPSSTTSTLSDVSMTSGGSGGGGRTSPSRPPSTRIPDARFSAGSTTRATYRNVSAYGEEARQKPVVHQVNLKMEGDFQRTVSSKEHYKEQPYSRTPACIRKQMIPRPSGQLHQELEQRGSKQYHWLDGG